MATYDIERNGNLTPPDTTNANPHERRDAPGDDGFGSPNTAAIDPQEIRPTGNSSDECENWPVPQPGEQRAQIANWLRALSEPGQVVELRALKVRADGATQGHTQAGYFDADHLDLLGVGLPQ
jgi:hypothetical protein